MNLSGFKLSDEKKKILNDFGYQLIMGEPGSGKTTISILKANQWIERIESYQKVLFLSFARASVARVIEAINEQKLINYDSKKRIEIDTYHAFFWRILKTHGYLLGLPRRLKVLSPSNESIALSNIRNSYNKSKDISEIERQERELREKEIIEKIALEDGEIAFDLFANLVFQLISESEKIKRLVSANYPVIILDEFQDTNLDQWNVLRCLGENSTVIALADPEQRIFEFLGADPHRIQQFISHFHPQEFDLRGENHRSSGRDIAEFGNDILKGKFKYDYKDVDLQLFPSNKNQAHARLRVCVFKSRQRLSKQFKFDWTLAILVPTKKLVSQVSEDLTQHNIYHYPVIDMAGVVLAAEVIAFLLQPKEDLIGINEFIHLVCNFFNGKGGDSPNNKDIQVAKSIQKAFSKNRETIIQNKSLPSKSILRAMVDGFNVCKSLKFIGNPFEDWLLVRNVLESSKCPRLRTVALEVRNLRLLNRGSQLRESLSQNWRNDYSYTNALEIVRQAFIVEHFATSQKHEGGIQIMNMHKSKGKQFDEVIIFEGWPKRIKGNLVGNPDRIVPGNINRPNLESGKYLLRVSVTRAKLHTTILTPEDDPCILLKK